MKPKVSIASLLPLLSAIATVESQHTRGYGSLSNQMRAPLGNEKCGDYNDISTWMDGHVKLHAQWRKFKAELDTLLIFLNGTTSLNKCCLFEETNLKLVIENINAIDQDSGNQEGQLKYSGDLGTDLENILLKIKEAVAQGFKSCCDNLQDVVKNLKDKLEEKLQDLTGNSNEVNPKISREKDELQNKLNDLKDKIKDLKERLETLETSVSKNMSNNKCCAELKGKTLELEHKVKTTRSEDDPAQKLDNQLKDLNEIQRNEYDFTNLIRKTTEDTGEYIKNITETCKKNCRIENGFEHITADHKQLNKGDLFAVANKLENLKKLVEKYNNLLNQLEVLAPTKDINATFLTCMENSERLKNIQYQIQELLNERTQSCFEAGGSRTFAIYNDKSISNSNCTFDKKLQDRIRELEQEEESLREELKKPPKCCQKIDELSLETNQLQSMLKEMNRSYNDTLKEYENQFKDIEESTNESVKKMGDINKTKNNESLQEKIKNLTKELDKANITLETLKDKQSDLFNSNNSSNNATNMLVELASLKRDFNEFRDNVDRQLKDIESQQLFSLSADAKDSLQLLENFNNDISRDMDKIKKNLLDRDSLAKQTQDQIAELKNQADIMLECQKRCTKINKMNDFIDRIEDMENLVKNL